MSRPANTYRANGARNKPLECIRVPYGCVLRQRVEAYEGVPIRVVSPVFVAPRRPPAKVYPEKGKAECLRRIQQAATLAARRTA